MTPAQQIIYVYGLTQWKVQNSVNLLEKVGNDYLITPGIGAHKLHTRKSSWNKARKICIQEGGEFLTRIVFNEGIYQMLQFCNSLVSNEDVIKLINKFYLCSRVRHRFLRKIILLNLRGLHCQLETN